MGGRYIITGAQIGELTVLSEFDDKHNMKRILKEITDCQFIEDSNTILTFDLKRYRAADAIKNVKKKIQESLRCLK